MRPVALITGGQQGIGLGIAEALREAGFALAIAAERPPQDVTEGIRSLGDSARYYQHDLSRIEAIPALLDRIEADLGPVTCLIQNAGVPARIRGDMLQITPDNFDFAMDINLRGAFFLAQAVARQMLDRPADTYRSLVFVTSVSAEMVSVERAEYCISKSAASMMARTFAARLAAHGIGVFEVRPGIIRTAMTESVSAKYDALIGDRLVPAGRWGEPADIGAMVCPLVTGQMHFATGAIIPADGGLSIPRL